MAKIESNSVQTDKKGIPISPKRLLNSTADVGQYLQEAAQILSPMRKDDIGPEVRLLGIEFEWDGAEAGECGISLHPVELGWEPEQRSNVTYDLASGVEAVAKGQLKIRARFYHAGGRGKVQIRSVAKEVGAKDVLTHRVRHQYEGYTALGSVAATTVFFNDTCFSVYQGKHTFVPLKLEGVDFPSLGVGVYDVNWHWEYRRQDEKASQEEGKIVWQEDWYTVRTDNSNVPLAISAPFQLTRHRIYITLEKATHPWTPFRIPDIRRGTPISLPMWSSALEVACQWAKGSKDKTEAAQKIANQLYACGRFVYDPDPNYTDMGIHKELEYNGLRLAERKNIAHFDFKKVLERIHGGYGLGEQINCLDCAMTVVAFANLLGCELRIGRLQNSSDLDDTDSNNYEENRFEIQDIRAIGYKDGDVKIADISEGEKCYFTYHTVAWAAANGQMGEQNDFLDAECIVYDACCEFKSGGAYHSASGYRLGDGETAGSYIYQLAANTPAGRPRCKPQPSTVVDIQIKC